MFADNGLRWNGKYIDHDVLWQEMTPEQEELFKKKCHKRDLHKADMMLISIQSAFASGEERFKPSDLLDRISKEAAKAIAPKTPKERRLERFAKWGYPKDYTDAQLIQYLKERFHDLSQYYTDDELKELEKNGIYA